VPHPDIAFQNADAIIRALRKPVYLSGREVVVGASVGLTFSPDGGATQPEDLVREADTALYEAKGAGKNRVVVFQPRMNTRVVQRLNLEADLRRAIERGEFVMHYQPEIELVSGEIVGTEALLRWRHPRLGLISPDDFIPLAEETGLIVPIGRWALEAACRQARRWQTQRGQAPRLTMSVNLSARQFQQDDLADQVAHVLHRTGLDPAALKLELTETVLLKDERRAARTLEHLRGLGLRLALDDFGTGYSSLGYLHRFAVDTLKVDRSFLEGLERNETAAAIVEAITKLAHALGMDVTVEGVETAEQLAHARLIHCDRGQGYFFSRPAPAEALTRLLVPEFPSLRQAS
jgi:EAL domain-containing protein (putative c-di-GMP-specific phosphodiesterase class I)